MSGELEAAGALTTAGLAAGAIEGREAVEDGTGLCANCGAQLTGRYCSNCGQAAEPHRTLRHMAGELLHGLFNFDTKLWRTLPLLMFRPGTLTRNYVYGKRARYLSPLALFLFCVFLVFFSFSLVPPPVNINSTPDTRADVVERLDDARNGVREVEQELAPIRQRIAAGTADVSDRAAAPGLETALAAAQAEVREREQAVTDFDAAAAREQQRQHSGLQVTTGVDPAQTGPTARIQTGAPPPPAPPSNGASTTTPAAGQTATAPATPAEPEIENPYPRGSLENALYAISQSEDFRSDADPGLAQRVRHKLENPPLLLYRLQDAASKFSFLLVPISLPFIVFLFLFKRGITLYDHTVFALYSLCFASLLFVVVITAGSVSWLQWIPAGLLAFGLPTHTFFHLKGAYALRWWSALWRTFFLLIFSVVSLAIFLALILVVGFAE